MKDLRAPSQLLIFSLSLKKEMNPFDKPFGLLASNCMEN